MRLSELPEVEVQDVAASLYIHPFMLPRWRKQAREGQIVTKGVKVDKAVSAELKQLRRMKKAYERLKIEPRRVTDNAHMEFLEQVDEIGHVPSTQFQ